MNRKTIIVLLNCVLVIILAVMSFFAYQTYVERQREAFIDKRQEALTPTIPTSMQEGKIGDTYATVFFPIDATGHRVPALERYLETALNEEVESREKTKEIKQLLFLTTKEDTSEFTGVRKVQTIREKYTVNGTTIKRKEVQDTAPVLLTTDYQLFTLTSLVKDPDAFRTILKTQVETDLRARQVADAEIATALASLDTVAVEQLGFTYGNSQLTMTLPTPLAGLEVVHLPIANLFPIVDSKYLSQIDQEAYEAYIAQKAAEEEAKKQTNRISLTFDDGPNPATTPHILATLKKYNVKATFFILGSAIPGNEAILKQIVADGHEVANHTWNHPALTTLSPEQIRQEIQQTQDMITQVTGKRPVMVRPPYGAVNATVMEYLGLPAVNWTVDSNDWRSRNATAILTEIQRSCHAGGIVLMHDIHQPTVDALPSVIEHLQAQGFSMVTASELLGSDLNPKFIYYGQGHAGPAQ